MTANPKPTENAVEFLSFLPAYNEVDYLQPAVEKTIQTLNNSHNPTKS